MAASKTAGTPLSYVHALGREPLLGLTIGKMFERAVERTPSKMAAVFAKDGEQRTFEQLHDKARKLAAGLLELGVKRGDRVGVYGPNTVEWLETQFAAAMVGTVLVNVNPSYRPNELLFALQKTSCSVLILAQPYKQDYYAVLSQVVPEIATASAAQSNAAPLKLQSLPTLRHVVTMGLECRPNTLSFAELQRAATTQRLAELDNRGQELQFDDPINIQFTSGTTGTPKGASLTHFNLLNNAYFFGMWLGYKKGPTPRICVPVPFYHTFGCVVGNLQIVAHNACVVVPDKSWNALETLHAIEKFDCDTIYGAPTMFVDLMNHPERSNFKFANLRRGVTGSAPSMPTFLQKIKSLFKLKELYVAYGSTELSPIVSATSPEDSEERQTTTAGQIFDHCEVKIVNPENMNIVKKGENGEVLVRGPYTMIDYWAEPAKTREILGPDRWYRTGDIGNLTSDPQDPNGKSWLTITSRIKDMIIRGGENIYPVEIEQLIAQHDAVADVHVVGVPDERLGEQVCACVRLKAGREATKADEIIQFCGAKLAHFKVPKYVLFMSEFPMTVTAKVPKYILRQIAAKQLNLDKIKSAVVY